MNGNVRNGNMKGFPSSVTEYLRKETNMAVTVTERIGRKPVGYCKYDNIWAGACKTKSRYSDRIWPNVVWAESIFENVFFTDAAADCMHYVVDGVRRSDGKIRYRLPK